MWSTTSLVHGNTIGYIRNAISICITRSVDSLINLPCKMKSFIITLFAVMVVAMAAEETYSSEYDDLDIEAVVNNPQTLQAYFGCFIGRDNCEKEPGHFKKDLSEAIQTACAKCTLAQKHILKRFTEELKAKFPQDSETFKQKFDPEGKYFVALEPVLAKA